MLPPIAWLSAWLNTRPEVQAPHGIAVIWIVRPKVHFRRRDPRVPRVRWPAFAGRSPRAMLRRSEHVALRRPSLHSPHVL